MQFTTLVSSPEPQCFVCHLTFLWAFDGIFVASSTYQQVHVYGCICAGLTQRFVLMIVVLHSTTVGGAKEQKLISQILCVTLKWRKGVLVNPGFIKPICNFHLFIVLLRHFSFPTREKALEGIFHGVFCLHFDISGENFALKAIHSWNNL